MKTLTLFLLLSGAAALTGCSTYQGGAQDDYGVAAGTAGSQMWGPASPGGDQLATTAQTPAHRNFPEAPPEWPPR